MASSCASVPCTWAVLGALSCFHAAIPPTTTKGKPPSAPNTKYSAGSKALAASANPTAMAKLIHHGERSRTAKSDFSAILNFKVFLSG